MLTEYFQRFFIFQLAFLSVALLKLISDFVLSLFLLFFLLVIALTVCKLQVEKRKNEKNWINFVSETMALINQSEWPKSCVHKTNIKKESRNTDKRLSDFLHAQHCR